MSLAKTAALQVRTYEKSPMGISFSAARRAFDRKGTREEQHQRHLQRIGKRDIVLDPEAMGEAASIHGHERLRTLVGDKKYRDQVRLHHRKDPEARELQKHLTTAVRRHAMAPGADAKSSKKSLSSVAALEEAMRNPNVRALEARWT